MTTPKGDYIICPCGTDVPVELALDGEWCSTTCKEDEDVHGFASDNRGPWMTTFTGKRFYLMDPVVEDITIEDIAHALAMTCRWHGHTNTFYSVAQHSVLTSLVADRPYRMAMLLHDAAEAYIGDLAKPIKRDTRLGESWRVMEDRIQEQVQLAFGYKVPNKARQKVWDNRVLLAEADDLVNQDWLLALRDRLRLTRYPEDTIITMGPTAAEAMFLRRYLELN
jgi:hypothetical protein